MDLLVTSIFVLATMSSAIAFQNVVKECRLQKVVGLENEFQIALTNTITIQKACPFRRIFSAKDCGCVLPPEPPTTPAPSTTKAILTTTPSNIPPPLCLPDVTISVEGPKIHGTGNGYIVPLVTENMAVDKDVLVFSGNSVIRLNLFDDIEFSNGLTVTLEFQEAANISQREILITNCDKKRVRHSFEIAVNRVHVEITIDLGGKTFYQTNVAYKRGANYKKITAIYDGTRLIVYVDNNRGLIEVEGIISKRSRPMLIGNTECPDSTGFSGRMKNVSIYRCVKESLLGRRYI